MRNAVGIQEDVGIDTVIWRYMDLSKLLDILVNKSLAFPRSDKFEDPYEGFANNYLELTKQSYMNSAFMIKPYYGYCETGLTRNLIKIVNLNSYVSCWHMNDYESAAMWKLYCKSSDSVAIKTTVKKLNYSLIEYTDNLNTGGISYDSKFEKIKRLEVVNIADPLFSKRESFEHEREYRMVWHNFELLKLAKNEMEKIHKNYHEVNIAQGKYNDLTDDLKSILESGSYLVANGNDLSKKYIAKINEDNALVKHLEVNPSDLIEEIIIAPNSPDWFVKTVKLTIKELGYHFPVRKSKLYDLD